VKESTLSWPAGFHVQRDCVGTYIKELHRKIGTAFCYEVRGGRWSRENPIEYKVWLTGEISLSDPPAKRAIPERLNPVFNGNLEHYKKDDLDGWRDLIHHHLLDLNPTGTDPIPLLWIDDRAELERVFPSFPFGRHSDGDKIAKFLSEIRVHPEIRIGYDFRSETDVWFALGKWTPTVEDELEKKIGIKCPWDSANLPAYLAELLSELNDRTPYELTLQPWKCYSEYKHRIRVCQKKSDEAVLIQQIQLLALKQGKTVSADRIRGWLSQLLDTFCL
jgi:hypothetical protein